MLRTLVWTYLYQKQITTTKPNIMTINLNTNTQTIKELVELGITNTYQHAPLCIQRRTLLELAVRMNLITLNK